MIVEAFKPEHAREIELQPAQAAVDTSPDYLDWLQRSGPCASLRSTDGVLLACAGVIDIPQGAYLWCLLSRHASRNMFAVLRAARRLMEVARAPIYATTECGFEPGCRMLELLGFERRERLQGVGPAGEAHELYVRNF